MCMIEGCAGKSFAKGLCVKHYMRQRRAGDPGSIGKPGRKRSPQRLLFEEMGLGMEWSSRTFTRFVQAMEMLREAGCDIKPCIEAALRRNGKLNVSKLQEIAFKHYIVNFCGASQPEAHRLWQHWKSTH